MQCEICDRNAHLLCAVCGKRLCTEDSKIVVSCGAHVKKGKDIPVTVREAVLKDEKVIDSIEESTILEHEAEVDEEEWERRWKGVILKQFVAESGGKVIGFVEYCTSVSPHEEPVLVVTDLAVLPDYQQGGVGRKLFDRLKKTAKDAGLSKVYTSTNLNNIPAILFHLKNGADILWVEHIREEGKRWGISGTRSIAFEYTV